MMWFRSSLIQILGDFQPSPGKEEFLVCMLFDYSDKCEQISLFFVVRKSVPQKWSPLNLKNHNKIKT